MTRRGAPCRACTAVRMRRRRRARAGRWARLAGPAEQCAHPADQRLGAERLLQEIAAGAGEFAQVVDVVGVARDEQHAQAGALSHQARGQFAPAQSRHDDVGDQQVDVAGVPGGQFERVQSVGSRHHREAGPGQQLDGGFAHVRVILGEQDGGLVGGRRLRRGRGLGLGAGLDARQVHRHRGAASGGAVDEHAAAALLDDAVHRRQPQARALAALLRREERVEGAGAGFLRHAGAVVRHHQRDIAARGEARRGARPGRRPRRWAPR